MKPTTATCDRVREVLADGLPLRWVLAIGLTGAACLHLAYAIPRLSFLLLFTCAAMAALSLAHTRRKAFYPVLLIGLVIYGPQLSFFWTIFGPPAVLLWLVLAFWLALFSVVAWRVRTKWGVAAWLIALPFLWTGIEYFRSELYYLRFSWINAGYGFATLPALPLLTSLGMYGAGFVLMTLVSLCLALGGRRRMLASVCAVAVLALLVNLPRPVENAASVRGEVVKVAGMQAEFPQPNYVPHLLDKLKGKFPEAELLVLSEYTFDGPVPEGVLDWCRTNGRYLIAGGKDPAGDTFYNTAFVISPAGEVVFKQVKAVPIQFFAGGLPAPEQKVWESPWGRLGICTCYDLSYTRVTDELIRQGAQAIINPTMDVIDWGEHQHALHSRVPPVRAAECGIPIFRVASSGVSQLIDRNGRELAAAPFGGDEAMLGGELHLSATGRLPLDRWFAPLCVGVAALLLISCFLPDRKPRPAISVDPSNS